MALNTQLNLGSGGDTMVTIDLANFATFGYTSGGTTPPAGSLIKLPAVCLYVSQAIGTVPTPVLTANPLPVNVQSALPAGANVIGHVICDSGSTIVLGAGAAAIGTVTTNADANLTAGTAPTKGLAIAGIFNTTAPAPTNGQTVGLQTDAAGSLLVSNEGRKATYSACSTSFALAATPTDIAQLAGSGTKTVKILRVAVTIAASAAQTQVWPITLIKRSTAGSGYSNTGTNVPWDSSDAAGTATMSFTTANPTPGSSVGTVAATYQTTVSFPASSGANGALTRWEWCPKDQGGKPLTLRGTGQTLAVNLGGGALTGAPTALVEYEWTEE